MPHSPLPLRLLAAAVYFLLAISLPGPISPKTASRKTVRPPRRSRNTRRLPK